MIQENFRYRIFDCVINSSIDLPELPSVYDTKTPDSNNLVFKLKDFPLAKKKAPQWFHHWYLPDGRVSLSCGKILEVYYLQFPRLADFKISATDNTIICFPADGVDEFTIRHLLLDQVIPRLLNHQGHLILHASGVYLNAEGLLFLGKTGHGKSTLAMALQDHGCSLVTDDCVSLKFTGNHVNCIPNYVGARLWPDSLAALTPQHCKCEKLGAIGKTRLYFPFSQNSELMTLPVKAIFFLDTLTEKHSEICYSITPVTGSDKFIEMNRHCFPLDITCKTSTHSQFQNMARLGKFDSIFFARLSYKKKYAALPEICQAVLSACKECPAPDSRRKS